MTTECDKENLKEHSDTVFFWYFIFNCIFDIPETYGKNKGTNAPKLYSLNSIEILIILIQKPTN